MTQHWTDVAGKLYLAELLVNNYAGTFVIKLFKNNVAVSHTSVIGDFVIADFSGYADQTVTGFTIPGFGVSGAGFDQKTDGGIFTWTQTSTLVSCDVYGYLVFDTALADVVFAELNPAGPVSMDATGKPYVVNLQVWFNNNPPP